MKINLIDVATKILATTEKELYQGLMQNGSFVLNGKTVTDFDADYDIEPGDKLVIWQDWFARQNKRGGTYIYFAPAILDDLHIFGVKKRGSKHEEVIAVPDDLTLANHEDKMGKRFKMTKAEIARFGKGSREEAFRARYGRDPATGSKV